ncbi:DgyrCDS6126 [Dimorphilus gyrociliatus]|uniref:E3 ubiquitin-protein ligase listerin n=1 Tax=Dimorphilus gyrociliatus TaxID=2664684 RepID=A0A7I8VM41_9ANNE|nr:DgyrCDS6126 [Dimorphilus gyrociliatus]
MGGKKKENRTKGNTRPSSSARAAEYLQQTGATASGFIGFSSLSGDLGYVPSAQGNDEIDNSVDSDFRMTLRKLHKKDFTTKVKALQEFCSLCENKETDDIKTVLHFWPRIYSRIGTDWDRRVREGGHNAQHYFAMKLKKELAPVIKQILPTWLMGICDPDVSVSNAARNGLNNVFQEKKRKEAIIFCAESTLETLNDYLLVQTAQTLSDAKTTSTVDSEAKYERTIAVSLLATKLVLSELNDMPNEKIDKKLSELLESNKFWKMAKSGSCLIKSAFYKLIAALCQHRKSLANSFSVKITQSVLHNIEEGDPTVVGSIWDAVLHTISYIEEWFKHVNLRKSTLPKLWSILRNAANGCSVIVMPNILPFVSKLPKEICDIGFYRELFTNLLAGLKQDKITSSISEISAIVQCMAEVCRYSFTLYKKNEDMNDEIINYVIYDVIKSFFKDALNDDNVHVQSAFIKHVSYLWKIGKEDDQTDRKLVSDGLWSILREHFKFIIENSSSKKCLKFGAEFLSHIGGNESYKFEKSVNFSQNEKMEKISKKYEFNTEINANLKEIVVYILTRKDIRQENDLNYIEFYCQIASNFLYYDILKDVYNGQDPADLNIRLYEDSIMHLLKKHGNQNVISLFFINLQRVENDRKLKLIESAFELLKSGSTLSLFLSTVIIELDHNAVKFFDGDVFTSFFSNIFNELLTEYNEQLWNILCICLGENDMKGIVLSEKLVEKLLDDINLHIPDNISLKEIDVDVRKAIKCSCEVSLLLFQKLPNVAKNEKAEKFVYKLFDLSFRSYLSEKMSKLIDESWCAGANCIALTKSINDSFFFQNARKKISFSLHNDCDTMKKLNIYVEKFGTILRVIAASDSLTTRALFFDYYDETKLNFEAELSHKWTERAVIDSNSLIIQDRSSLSKIPLTFVPKCMAPLVFWSCVEILTKEICDTFNLSSSNRQNIFQERIVDCIAAITFGEQLKVTNFMNKDDFSDCCLLLEKNIFTLIESINEKDDKEFFEDLINSCLDRGKIYLYGIQYLLKIISKGNKLKISKMSLRKIMTTKETSKITGLELNKVWIKYLIEEPEERLHVFEELERIFNTIKDPKLILSHDSAGYLDKLQLFNYTCQHVVAHQPDNTTLKDKVISCCKVLADKITIWKENCPNFYLFNENNNVKECPWNEVQWNIELIKFFKICVSVNAIEHPFWDVLLCALSAYVPVIEKESLLVDLSTAALAIEAFSLCSEIGKFFNSSSSSTELKDEWINFFSADIYRHLFEVFMYISQVLEGNSTYAYQEVLLSLTGAINFLPPTHFLEHELPPLLDTTSYLPDKVVTLFNHVFPLLERKNVLTQNCAALILERVTKLIPKTVSDENDYNDYDKHSPPDIMLTTLMNLTLKIAKFNTAFGERISIKELTDEIYDWTGFIYCWNVLLTFCEATHYAYLKENNLIQEAIHVLFSIMPDPKLPGTHSKILDLFNRISKSSWLDKTPKATSEYVEWIASSLYLRLLERLPALVRKWYNLQDKVICNCFKEFTSSFASKILISKEIKQLKAESISNDEFTILLRETSGEVVASYIHNEVTLEVEVTFPADTPLTPVVVKASRKIGADENKWRKWILQMTTFLSLQNGTLLESLLIWKNNVKKLFDDVEECTICFSVLHPTNYQLPKLQCSTCRKKFHPGCLYKWFNTSNKSTCPLCRGYF